MSVASLRSRGNGFETTHCHIQQWAHNCHLSRCQFTVICSRVSSIKSIIYAPMPAKWWKFPLYLARSGVVPFGLCQFVFDGWVMFEWLRRWPPLFVVKVVSEIHDDVIKWKHFPHNWPFVWGIHRSRWIPHTKARDAERWCFLWSGSEYTIE